MALPIFQTTSIPRSSDEEVGKKSGRERESTDQKCRQKQERRGKRDAEQGRVKLGQNERSERETKNGTQIGTVSDRVMRR